ncbi:extracellular solute-binding protein [Paenibacillus sp. FSL H3-0469]|uniref:extracellular solute-binding protein n=1 Tax=Paenibacillus sp. FSL H3-0469 TaxID=2954506 RepID=UPI00310157FD
MKVSIFVKRSVSILVVTSMLLVSACSSGTKEEGAEGKEKRQAIDIVLSNAGRKFPPGMDENNNPYIDYIRENTGLDIKLITPPADGYGDALNVIMASDDLPDMLLSYDANWFESYVRQKALTPLNNLIDEYGPNLKKSIPEEAWKVVTVDGKIYAIPGLNPIPGNEIMFARKDWLDRLGLKPPTTLEEYKQVIRAFAQDDPDGNGKNDTFGLILQENLGRVAPFIGAWGIQRGQWTERDGQLVNSSTLPEMKEALSYLAGLYKEKLIDPEWALNKMANVDEKVASGKVGLFSGNWYDTRGPILTNQKNDPNAEWITLEYPTGPDGKQGTWGNSYVSGFNVIPVTSKHPEAVIKMLDFMIGDGYRTLMLGFEGEVWNMEDGKVVTNFDEHNKHIYRLTLGEAIVPFNSEVSRERLDSLGMEFKLNEIVDKINKVAIRNQYLGVPTPGMGKYGPKLSKMEVEAFTKIIIGQQPVDSFDQFVEDWKKNGGEEMTKEVNGQ